MSNMVRAFCSERIEVGEASKFACVFASVRDGLTDLCGTLAKVAVMQAAKVRNHLAAALAAINAEQPPHTNVAAGVTHQHTAFALPSDVLHGSGLFCGFVDTPNLACFA
jgi:hypothetical protein